MDRGGRRREIWPGRRRLAQPRVGFSFFPLVIDNDAELAYRAIGVIRRFDVKSNK